jgi:N-methylhydantoinase A
VRGVPDPGTELTGPAVVELPEATVLVPPGWSGRIDATATIVLERSA